MKIPPPVTGFCHTRGYGPIRSATPLGGGCINNATRLDTDNGPLFLKTNSSCPPDMFTREAEGLAALTTSAGPRVPTVLLVGPDFILQEYIEPRADNHDGRHLWETLGAQLAALHTHTAPRFGFEHDNYIGATAQINTWEADGHLFFAEHRLRYQGELAYRNHRLDQANYQLLNTLLAKLPALIPTQPAALLHGDLWSGNIHADAHGQPVLIDPAVYYGWPEAELAMMCLFGSPPESFFKAYETIRPLAPGYRDRFDLYNLYHLPNHLSQSRSYLGSVRAILTRYR